MRQTTITFEERFLTQCRERKFFSKNDRVLLAVSGGQDSMALSHLIGAAQYEFGIKVGMVHLNHSLRGLMSDRDDLFVRNFALSHKYPFYHKKINVRRHAKLTKTSIEEAARNVRYAFLEKIAQQYGYNKICTAHHSGDQAETILMRIIKGSGLSGLSGIREKRGLFIRPLLNFSKQEIIDYVQQKKIKYLVDHSNRDTAFLRNRIRHQLMPILKKKFDPQIEKHLIQLGLIAAETKSFMKHHAKKQFLRVCYAEDGKIVLEIKAFNRYLRAQRQAIIESIFEEYFTQKLQYLDYQKLFDLIEKKQSGKKILFGKIICIKTSAQIIFHRRTASTSSDFSFDIEPDQSYSWEKPRLSFKSIIEPNLSKLRKRFGLSSNTEYIDLGKVKGRLKLRSWKNGDRFRPLGMKGFKNLSDFFIDNKVSVTEKKKIPILCEKNGKKENIIWVCGFRIDERYKIDNATHQTLKLECNRHEKDH